MARFGKPFDDGNDRFRASATSEEFLKAHRNSDVDNEPSSQHHTLGRGPNNAAAGNHNHSGTYALVDHTHEAATVGQVIMYLGSGLPSAEFLELNGQTIFRVDYPEFFVVMEVPAGTDNLVLPDWRDKFPVGSGTHANRTTGGSSSTTTSANVAAGADVDALTVITSLEPAYAAVRFLVKVA